MSAWRIGSSMPIEESPEGTRDLPQRGGSGQRAPLTAALDTLVKWVPGEIIAFYAAATFALRETLSPSEGGDGALTSQPTPYAVWLLVGAVALTVLVTAVAAVSRNLDAGGPDRAPWWEVLVTAVLAMAAFVAWSLTVPGSYWSGEGVNGSVALVVVAAFALGFVPLAELLTRWMPTKRPGPDELVAPPADEDAAVTTGEPQLAT